MHSITQEVLQKHQASEIKATEGHVLPDQMDFFVQFLLDHPEIKTVLEIGFNAGHSAATFLATRPDINVISIDLAAHDYVIPAKKWIDSLWPKRHLLIVGDSVQAMQVLHNFVPEFHPDLIFVDGGHDEPYPITDLRNALQFASPSSWIIVDDTCAHMPAVLRAIEVTRKEFKFAPLYKAQSGPYAAWIVGKKLG